jgi:hypothetical protein
MAASGRLLLRLWHLQVALVILEVQVRLYTEVMQVAKVIERELDYFLTIPLEVQQIRAAAKYNLTTQILVLSLLPVSVGTIYIIMTLSKH